MNAVWMLDLARPQLYQSFLITASQQWSTEELPTTRLVITPSTERDIQSVARGGSVMIEAIARGRSIRLSFGVGEGGMSGTRPLCAHPERHGEGRR